MTHFKSAHLCVAILGLFTLGCGADMAGGPFGNDSGSAKFTRNSDNDGSDSVDVGGNDQYANANGSDDINGTNGNNGNGTNGNGTNGNNTDAGGSNAGNGTVGGTNGSQNCKWLQAGYAEPVNIQTQTGETFNARVSFMAHDPSRYGKTAYRATMYLVQTASGWEDDQGQPGSKQMIAQLELQNASNPNCQLAVTKASAPERNNAGCFHPHTKIRLADGRDVPIAFLQPEDQVWNPATKQSAAIKRIIAGPEKPGFYQVTTNDGVVRVTEKHPFETRKGLRAADQLTLDSYVLGADGRFHRVKNIRQLSPQPGAYAWNVELDTQGHDPRQHMVMADGVVTGDLFLQEKLAERAAPKALAFSGSSLELNTSLALGY